LRDVILFGKIQWQFSLLLLSPLSLSLSLSLFRNSFRSLLIMHPKQKCDQSLGSLCNTCTLAIVERTRWIEKDASMADSVSDRREVLPQELDYRVATVGFENCRAPGVPGEGGVAG